MARRRPAALLPDVTLTPPTLQELLDWMDRTLEPGVREIASRWHDSLPAAVRLELHDLASPATRFLIRAGRR